MSERCNVHLQQPMDWNTTHSDTTMSTAPTYATLLIQMDVNLCIWSQTPCRFNPYLPLHPHMKRMGPHFMTAQLCSVGFSVHTNIPSMQPTQQLN